MDKKALLELLAENQLPELFNALKVKQGYYQDLILLESKWNDLRAKQRNDLITTEQANIGFGQIRNSLLQLIELSEAQPGAFNPPAAKPNRIWILLVCAAVLIAFLIYHFSSGDAPESSATGVERSNVSPAAPGKTAASPATLNVSEARPITLAAGSEQYERVYSVVKTSVESIGGGKSLITLTIGLNFKGIINDILSSDKFRLIADELPGPLAPANFLSKLVDSRSYVEGDIKFELSDQIRKFKIVIEGKEDKIWHFSR